MTMKHSNFTQAKVGLVCLIATLTLFWGREAFSQTVRIAVGTVSIASLPTWVAKESGYFVREGLQAELIYIRGGPQTLSALVGGDVNFAQVYSGPILSARLTGADTVIVAGLVNQPLFSVVTAPGIDKPEDLRG